ncbi:peptidyl-tRNA hydrolase 2, mitochondrial isoform X2 [Linepithema humile]|nr:PREDICTED: peptidyl-tRNA hydrolase 2, mitochondrial isoform X2 [Linepithema humile]
MTNKNSSDDLDETDAEVDDVQDAQRDDAVFLNTGEFDKYEYDYFKLVLVIRTDLKMGKGKVAAQCSHAAVAAYKTARRVSSKAVKIWEKCGQAKIILKVDSEAELMKIAKQAKDMGLISNMIQDAGHTQIPAGSRTVCAIGPGPAKLIDQVTGHLKLF